jgi:hypothetical protein
MKPHPLIQVKGATGSGYRAPSRSKRKSDRALLDKIRSENSVGLYFPIRLAMQTNFGTAVQDWEKGTGITSASPVVPVCWNTEGG